MSLGGRLLHRWYGLVDSLARVGDLFVWFILNVFAVEVYLQECRQRKSDAHQLTNGKDLDFSNVADKKQIQDYSEIMLKEAKNRYLGINEKAHILFAFSAFSLVLFLWLLPDIGVASPHYGLFLLPVAFVLVSLSLLLVYHGVDVRQTPVLTQGEIRADCEDLKTGFIKTLLFMSHDLDRTSDYLCNVYIATRRSMFIAWGVFVVGVICKIVCR